MRNILTLSLLIISFSKPSDEAAGYVTPERPPSGTSEPGAPARKRGTRPGRPRSPVPFPALTEVKIEK